MELLSYMSDFIGCPRRIENSWNGIERENMKFGGLKPARKGMVVGDIRQVGFYFRQILDCFGLEDFELEQGEDRFGNPALMLEGRTFSLVTRNKIEKIYFGSEAIKFRSKDVIGGCVTYSGKGGKFYDQAFIEKSSLPSCLSTMGHELGHLIKPDGGNEESSYALELATNVAIAMHNIGDLGISPLFRFLREDVSDFSDWMAKRNALDLFFSQGINPLKIFKHYFN